MCIGMHGAKVRQKFRTAKRSGIFLSFHLKSLYRLYLVFQPCHAKFEQAEIMNFLDKHPSENRMEFTKLKVACKYASIERGCACS